MPTYDYACPKCGHQFEAFQSMNDAPLTKCPSCKKAGVKRLIGGGAGLMFKGSGFYETDYKRKAGTNGSTTATPAASTPKSCEGCSKAKDSSATK